MSTNTCATCRFVLRDGKEMVCRRNPPTLNVVIVPAPPPRVNALMPMPISGFPPVNDGMWCGAYQGNEAAVMVAADMSRLWSGNGQIAGGLRDDTSAAT